jgi:hypothetical protein
MKKQAQFTYFIVAAITLVLCGCASTDDYRDEQEYSDMPWNTPQQWEGSRSIPGLSPGY